MLKNVILVWKVILICNHKNEKTEINMDNVIELTLKIYLWILLAIGICYIPRISYYFSGFKKQKRLKNDVKNKIAVIVPARWESSCIRDCLDSLKNQTYDPAFYDIHVVVSHDSDPTVRIASGYPNTFVTVIEDQTSKAEALDGVLKKIVNETPDKYAAYVFIDADNIAAPDFIEEMNNSLVSGSQIICGKKLIKNWIGGKKQTRTFVSNCTALTYAQVDDLGNKARSKRGITINICGTGFMVRKDVVSELGGWPYRSLTEDFELTADSIIRGFTSLYYEHAKVYTEEALQRKVAFKRKMRWIKGYTQCNSLYRLKIFKKTFGKDKQLKNVDFLYGAYPVYAFFIVSALIMLFGGVSLILSAFSLVKIDLALMLFLLPLGFMYGSLFLFTMLTLIVDRKNIKIPLLEKVALLFFNPVYTFGYVRIFITAFLTPFNFFKWEATERITEAHVKYRTKAELVKFQYECERTGDFHAQIQPNNSSKVLPVTEKHQFIRKGPFNAVTSVLARGAFSFAGLAVNPVVFRLKVIGRKNIRGIKSAVVTCNHVHMMDCLPVRRACRGHKLFITVADFNNRNDLLGSVMRAAGTLPFSSNIRAMQNLSKAVDYYLTKNNYVLFYPEMTLWWQYEKPRPHKNGAYYFASKNGVPVVPMFITFERKGKKRPKATIHIMKPVYPRDELSRRENEEYLKSESVGLYKEKYEEVYGKELVYNTEFDAERVI